MAMFGHSWAGFDGIRQIWALSTKSGQVSPRFVSNCGRIRPKFRRTLPDSAEMGPNLAEFSPRCVAPHLAGCGRNLADVCGRLEIAAGFLEIPKLLRVQAPSEAKVRAKATPRIGEKPGSLQGGEWR